VGSIGTRVSTSIAWRGERDTRRRASTPRLKAGTVLVREYQGERHTVTVVPGGFVWQGATYPSLSTTARAITGTAWNGPRFFGLRVATERDGEENGPHPNPGVTTGSLPRRPTRRRLAHGRGG
jgi:hypothetical protein